MCIRDRAHTAYEYDKTRTGAVISLPHANAQYTMHSIRVGRAVSCPLAITAAAGMVSLGSRKIRWVVYGYPSVHGAVF